MSASAPIRLLHFADAHIDMANYGRHDPVLGLPLRVVDFLKSLDTIVETAIAEKVDLVIFAGDAYRDRNPHPTFQREWGKRIMRLSQAQIPTILLVGNHDVSPAAGRAHTLQEFNTLQVPYIHVADRFALLGPDELGLPVQVITVPWLSRSMLLREDGMLQVDGDEVLRTLEETAATAVTQAIAQADPALPLILTAHVSVDGAKYGSERQVMLGRELVLSHNLVRSRGLDYVALGHIHRHQDLNPGSHPPVVYPGSIERIDFGEEKEDKGFVLAEVGREKTTWKFHKLATRRFLTLRVTPRSAESFMEDLLAQLPPAPDLAGAICRVIVSYDRTWETMLDEAAISARFADALEVHIIRNRTRGGSRSSRDNRRRGRPVAGGPAGSLPADRRRGRCRARHAADSG